MVPPWSAEVSTNLLLVPGHKYITELLTRLDMVKGLKKSDLLQNKHGRIVSRKKHAYGKSKGLKQLHAKGYFTRKGHFGAVKKGSKTAKKSRRKGKSGKKGRRCRHKSGKKKGLFKKCKTKKRR